MFWNYFKITNLSCKHVLSLEKAENKALQGSYDRLTVIAAIIAAKNISH
jgi:hypothetical protein